MGLDLKLLPIENEHTGDCYSHTILSCSRSLDLFDEIMQLPSIPLSEPIECYLARSEYGGRCYNDVIDSDYGEPLKWIRVEELWHLRIHKDVLDNFQNKAIWAYLNELPAGIKIVLFWC
jgi:hypothetical protein